MVHKVTVGLQKKIGQPNFGSVGASCCLEVQLKDEEVSNPAKLAETIEKAYATCRQSIAEELETHHHDSPVAPPPALAEPTSRPRTRSSTEAQVRAIRAIASKAGVQLASELDGRFGVRSPSQLSLAQASELIDDLKSQLAPA